ncbi:MAG: phosphoribosylaminoimidazolesuccinocarboxamide synthase, partial [Pseudomonadales bacterium]
MTDALMATDLPLPNKRTGKVRDLYDLQLPDGTDGILIIATDRVSVFDVVLANGIPGKGALLTQISRFWFDFFAADYAHHLISTDPADLPDLDDGQRAQLEGRIMICRKTEVVPVECIVRGYLTGSGFKDYQKTGEVCGIALPSGMVN